MRRREADLPEERVAPAGVHLTRHPGAVAVWCTRSYRAVAAEGGTLFEVGLPESVLWFAEARPATRDEVAASIKSGLPTLRALADGPGGLALLNRQILRAIGTLPAA